MSNNKIRCSDLNNLDIDTSNNFDIFSEAKYIDWQNLDFKDFNLTLEEIDVIIDNFSNFLKTNKISKSTKSIIRK
jgi:hypothetical protein